MEGTNGGDLNMMQLGIMKMIVKISLRRYGGLRCDAA
jgi:hypothetical protein